MRAILLSALLLAGTPAFAQGSGPVSDETAIRQVVADWYAELQKREDRYHWRLFAPGAIDGGPKDTRLRPEWRSMGPTASNELAARALRFAYDIHGLKIDPRLAKVTVWERGYFYASANQQTYENAASALFVMEKQADGRWLILAHEANGAGIPDTLRTDPLPDMRPVWQALHGDAQFPPDSNP